MDLSDFCDIVYAYAIHSPDPAVRSATLGYLFDFKEGPEPEEDRSFGGFKNQVLNSSLLDELDAFNS